MICMGAERRFSIWTVLAPIALIVVVVVAFTLAWGAITSPPPRSEQPTDTTTAQTTTVDASVPAIYQIRKGDTLSAIAERYGVTTDYLVQLNPQLNPMALTVHAKIRLR